MSHSLLRELIEPGGFGPLRCEGLEILRRLFITVRDRDWQENAPTQSDQVIDETSRTATLSARHTSELVDFEWQGTLKVSEDCRALRFAFEGRARRDMEVCRLGLVVLHPVECLLGAQLTATGPQGRQRFTVARHICPQPIVAGLPLAMTDPFSVLILDGIATGRGVLELRFDGDLFELEDQRNWGDASFKTYCTPLRLGFPRAVAAGTMIAHSIEVQFTPVPVLAHAKRKSSRSKLRSAPSGRFPALGRVVRDSRAPQAPGEDALAWQHLHLDVLSDADITSLKSWLKTSPLPLQIGITADASHGPSSDFVGLLRAHQTRLVRWLLYGAGLAPPTAADVDRWRRRWEIPGSPQIPMLAAVRGHFVEFNRATAFDARVTGIAVPLSATVHSDDAATIVDNVATIGDMAETARRLSRRSDVVIAPLALYYPNPPQRQNFPRPLIAPWLTATLIHAAAGQIDSITLAIDVLECTGAPFLARFIECAGLDAWLLDTADSGGLHAVALGEARRAPARLLVCNLATRSRTLPLASSSLQVAKAIDAVSGREIAVGRVGIEVPARSVAWAELA